MSLSIANWPSDGYDKIDTMGGPGSSTFRNQIVGLLQAVQYLKGVIYFVPEENCY